jgi:hypothetical protein
MHRFLGLSCSFRKMKKFLSVLAISETLSIVSIERIGRFLPETSDFMSVRDRDRLRAFGRIERRSPKRIHVANRFSSPTGQGSNGQCRRSLLANDVTWEQ